MNKKDLFYLWEQSFEESRIWGKFLRVSGRWVSCSQVIPKKIFVFSFHLLYHHHHYYYKTKFILFFKFFFLFFLFISLYVSLSYFSILFCLCPVDSWFFFSHYLPSCSSVFDSFGRFIFFRYKFRFFLSFSFNFFWNGSRAFFSPSLRIRLF